MRRIALLAFVGMVGLSAAASAAPAKHPAAWATGRIERFDAGTKTLVLAQGKHDMTFTLAPDAHILQGKKALSTADLGSDVGRPVRVQYTMAGATRTAQRVQVRDAAKAKAAKGVHKATALPAAVVKR
jgi:hypothetical protein